MVFLQDGPWLGFLSLGMRSTSFDTLLKTQNVSGFSARRWSCRLHPNSNLRLAARQLKNV